MPKKQIQLAVARLLTAVLAFRRAIASNDVNVVAAGWGQKLAEARNAFDELIEIIRPDAPQITAELSDDSRLHAQDIMSQAVRHISMKRDGLIRAAVAVIAFAAIEESDDANFRHQEHMLIQAGQRKLVPILRRRKQLIKRERKRALAGMPEDEVVSVQQKDMQQQIAYTKLLGELAMSLMRKAAR